MQNFSPPKNPRLWAAAKTGIGFVLLFLIASPASACPMCKDSTVENETSTQSASGLEFNRSIFVMLGGFVGIVGLTGRVMYKAAKSQT